MNSDWATGIGYRAYDTIQYYWNQLGTVYGTGVTEVAVVETTSGSSLADEILKRHAIDAFNRFHEVWDFSDFWKRANTCDACISFADALSTRFPDDPEVKKICQTVKKMLEEDLVYFTTMDLSDKWQDDLGWCGMTGFNGYKFLKKHQDDELAKGYLDFATSCWEKLSTLAYDNTEGATPVAHGCRNNIPLKPEEGVKNTVVNALLFLLSTSLYSIENIPNRDQYLKMSLDQWVWFSSWFEIKESQYLKPFIGETMAALVQERPLRKDSSYQDTSHPDWQPGWTWSADQGLILKALLELLANKDNLAEFYNRTYKNMIFDGEGFEKKIKDYIQRIAEGVQKGLIGKSDAIFHEAPCVQSLSNYGNDYLCGRGILVRYLALPEIKNLCRIDFTANIAATLNALLLTKDEKTNQFKPAFTEDSHDQEYVKQFESYWGTSDKVTHWSLTPTDAKIIDGLSQSIGLDFLGKALLMHT